MKYKLLIATVAALSFLGATAASAQTMTRSTQAGDNIVRPNSQTYSTYLPGQGGCVDDNGFGRLQPCSD